MSTQRESQEEEDRLALLRRHLVDLCRKEGPIPFARYMETCLYHPQLGYYTGGPPPMGPEGDFITYPSHHPVFGRLVARQVAECWHAMENPSPFTLVEAGGGRGTLMMDLLGYVRTEVPDLWDALRVVLVDESPVLRERQNEIARMGDRVRVLDPEAFFHTAPFIGCLISNELMDALPVHLVEKRDGAIQEVFVDVGEEAVRETLNPPSTPRIPEYLASLGAQIEDGQRSEVHLAAVDWIQQVASMLQQGLVITIDFGYSGPEYFHPLRSGGTLMAYRGRLASVDPYELPGGQDLCAHVNFSALAWAGEEAGLKFTGLVTQDRFFMGLGLLDEMETQEARRGEMNPVGFWKEKLALRQFLMPQFASGGFQVLFQHKGWNPPPLRGLTGFPG